MAGGEKAVVNYLLPVFSPITLDGLAESRLTGENRCPEVIKIPEINDH